MQIACLKQQHSLSFTVYKTQDLKQDLSRKSGVFICCFIGSVVKILLSEAATGGVLYTRCS